MTNSVVYRGKVRGRAGVDESLLDFQREKPTNTKHNCASSETHVQLVTI